MPKLLIISAPIPRELPVTSATFPVKSRGSFMTIAALVESSGAQSMRMATRSTKYEWQWRATRSTAGVEMLETPLATRTSTSQCKRRSRTTHRTQQGESSEIRAYDWPDKKPIRPQTLRKNGVPDRDRLLPIHL